MKKLFSLINPKEDQANQSLTFLLLKNIQKLEFLKWMMPQNRPPSTWLTEAING
jgi:hypothetical protein